MAMTDSWHDKGTWARLEKALFSPKPEGLDAKIDRVKQNLPVPVFWLFGKTQSGKTSVIRALTGNDMAEIGNGFQPCTKTSRFYDFPSSSHPMIRFLDTRGIGETAYDPSEDLTWCAEQAHLLLVVLRALDMNQAEVVAAVQAIYTQHSNWPIIVVQTTLHEGYPTNSFNHIQPYVYEKTPFPAEVPHSLAQVLLHQRDWFKGLPVHFVAVDFTQIQEGYDPVNYGLEALWETIETVLPDGVIGLLRGSEQHKELLDYHAQQAHPHIVGYALLNAGMGALPAPAMGLSLVLAIQAKLFHSIASIYGLKLTRRLYVEFSTLLGSGISAGLLGRELLKFIPVYGWAVAGAYSGSMTYALGKVFCVYLNGVNRGALPDHSSLQKIYDEAFAHARQLLKSKTG